MDFYQLKKRIFCNINFLLFYTLLTSLALSVNARDTYVLKDGWLFFNGPVTDGHAKNLNHDNWESVKLPHDWAIKGPFIIDGNGSTGKLPWKGVGWYRNTLPVLPAMKGKTIYLIFDGIMAFPNVFVNGQLAGKWDYGYNSFYLDVTPFIDFDGENTIAIKADTRNHDSRYYPGAGIFRKIQMVTVNPVHVGIWGSYVTTPIIKPGYTQVRVAHTIHNNTSGRIDSIRIDNEIISPNGFIAGKQTAYVSVLSGGNSLTESTITLIKPEKWDIDNPAMYHVETKVSIGDRQVDKHTTPFGIRTIRFDADNGFFLNDRRVQLKGVNLHHDLGPLGAAFNKRALERQLEIMKEMGCNAIRNSHNTAAPELPELCDKMGLLLFNEVFDKYDEKGGFVEGADFEDFAQRNIKNFVLRDRNHPSIFLWSVGNEIMDVMRNENNGFYRLHTMVNYVRKYDATRPVTLVSSAMETAALRHFDYYDVHCWNYARRYALARQMEPNKSVIISESASTLSTRGFYELPLPNKKTNFTKSLQVSSYDLNAPAWAEIADDDFMWQEEEPYIAGEFVWTGFDYLGEPTPYDNATVLKMGMTDAQASRSSYFGIVDLGGIPKDRYYLYKSQWRPNETTLHILPHWNWKGMEGQNIPVFIYTNGDSAELFLNGTSLGFRKKVPDSGNSTERYRLMWKDVAYSPGKLKAVAYKNGEPIAEKEMVTAGEPYKIKLSPDRSDLIANDEDLSFIMIEVFDKDGNICPLADNLIDFEISGPGVIKGLANGNPQSFEPFLSNSGKVFYGKSMLFIGSTDTKGDISIKATSKGLKPAKTVLIAN